MNCQEPTPAQLMIGTQAGRWQILGISGKVRGNIMMNCRCACGAEKTVRLAKLSSGTSKSCGCLRNDAMTTHGQTKSAIRKQSHEYWVWNAMKNRCLNPNYKHFKDYGGRGITVCERWLNFNNFFADMGRRPSEAMTLERLDNSKGYSPDNCCWADRPTQSRNKRNNHYITVDGIERTVLEWARVMKISHSTILGRLKSGWDPALAATTPKNALYNGQPTSL